MKKPSDKEQWLEWAVELQSLAQAGLFFSDNPFEKERFHRIRHIAAEMIAAKADLDLNTVEGLFCNEKGYQTPKIDTRGVVFQGNKILLVQEKKEMTWSIPGGYVDVNQTIRNNTKKEVLEESGYTVTPERVLLIQDKSFADIPKAFGICKIFVECHLIGGHFQKNLETAACDFFTLEHLPELCTRKTNLEQIKLCFEAHQNKFWQPLFI